MTWAHFLVTFGAGLITGALLTYAIAVAQAIAAGRREPGDFDDHER